MKILMFPGKVASDNNEYINILTRHLNSGGVDVVNWNKYIPFQNGDIFHVHWPDILFTLRARRYRQFEGDFFIWNFFNTIERIKAKGGKIFWTVHNLKPHSSKISEDPLWGSFLERFLASVDGYFALTEAGLPEIWAQYPALAYKPYSITPHPHYRDVVGRVDYDDSYKRDHLHNSTVKLLACLGNIRPNKMVDVAAKVIKDLPQGDYHLKIAGEVSGTYKAYIQSIVEGAENITASYERLSPKELQDAYAAVDAVLLPAKDYFNSGTIFMALSLDVPVIAAATPTNVEIQKNVGDQWLFLYDGELTPAAIREAFERLVERKAASVCDLSQYEPSLCARVTISGYESMS